MWIRKASKIAVTKNKGIYPVVISLLWIFCFEYSSGARLTFKISSVLKGNIDVKGIYRLHYDPPIGYPLFNKTYVGSLIFNTTLNFTNLLPGNKYTFQLFNSTNNTEKHSSNSNVTDNAASIKNSPIWSAKFTTVPNPPKNIVFNHTNDTIHITWNPPDNSGVTQYKLRLQSFAKEDEGKQDRNFTTNDSYLDVHDFLPGITYKVKIWSIFDKIESTSYTSRNFTTKPNSPELIIMWYRNETSLFTMWNSPDPPGLFSGFQVSISPKDGAKNLFVPKDGPGTAQAVFNHLVPGRLYNISIKTVSKGQYSKPVFAQYRTVPKRPKNMTVDFDALTPHSAEISWESPMGEYDRYQLQIKEELGELKSTKIFVPKDSSTTVMFEDLVANTTYRVIAQTMSGRVASWPSTLHFTTKADILNNTRSNPDLGPTNSTTATSTTPFTPVISSKNLIANVTTTSVPIINSTSTTTISNSRTATTTTVIPSTSSTTIHRPISNITLNNVTNKN